jgi:hypothetical protein
MNIKSICILLLLSALLLYGCTSGQPGQPGGQVNQCPANCDAKELCTIGYCSASTNFECKYNKTENCYLDERHKYSVVYPDDWKTGDKMPTAVYLNTVDQSNDSAHCMIQSMNSQDILDAFPSGYSSNETMKQELNKLFNHSLEELVSKTKPSLFGENRTILSEKKRTISGVEAHEIIYTYVLTFYQDDYTKPSNIIYGKSQVVVFTRNLTDYQIDCSSRENNFERYKPAFESIITSFKLSE